MGLNRVGRLPRRRGKLLSVSNESGHYSPTPSSLQHVMGRLAEMGVAGLQDVRLMLIRREAYEVRSEASNSDLQLLRHLGRSFLRGSEFEQRRKVN